MTMYSRNIQLYDREFTYIPFFYITFFIVIINSLRTMRFRKNSVHYDFLRCINSVAINVFFIFLRYSNYGNKPFFDLHNKHYLSELWKSLKITHILKSGFIFIHRKTVQSVNVDLFGELMIWIIDKALASREEGGILLTEPKLIPLRRPLKMSPCFTRRGEFSKRLMDAGQR